MSLKTLTLKLQDKSFRNAPLKKVVLTGRGAFEPNEVRDALRLLGIEPNTLSEAVTMHVAVNAEDLQRIVDEAYMEARAAEEKFREEQSGPKFTAADIEATFAQGKRAGYTRGFMDASDHYIAQPDWFDQREAGEVLRERAEVNNAEWAQAERWVPPSFDTLPDRQVYNKECPYKFWSQADHDEAVAKARQEGRDEVRSEMTMAGNLYTQAELDAKIAEAVARVAEPQPVVVTDLVVKHRDVWDIRGDMNEWQRIGDFIYDADNPAPQYGDFVSVEGFPPCTIPMPNPANGYMRIAGCVRKDMPYGNTSFLERQALLDGGWTDDQLAEKFVPAILTVLQ